MRHITTPEPGKSLTGYAGTAQMPDLEVIHKPFDLTVLIDQVTAKLLTRRSNRYRTLLHAA